jgi:hypothetical protein
VFIVAFAMTLNVAVGVDAVIHAAAPLPGTQDAQSALNVTFIWLCACPCMTNMVDRMLSKAH